MPTHFALLNVLTISPLIWMVSSAFKTGTDVYNVSPIPRNPTLANFEYVFTQAPFLRYMLNSLFVSATVTIVVALPTMLLFFIFQRQLVESIKTSGFK